MAVDRLTHGPQITEVLQQHSSRQRPLEFAHQGALFLGEGCTHPWDSLIFKDMVDILARPAPSPQCPKVTVEMTKLEKDRCVYRKLRHCLRCSWLFPWVDLARAFQMHHGDTHTPDSGWPHRKGIWHEGRWAITRTFHTHTHTHARARARTRTHTPHPPPTHTQKRLAGVKD